MATLTKPEVQSVIDALGLSYRADFVPFSVSRNAKPKPRLADLQLNWSIRLAGNGTTIHTDYSQGIAHIPGYKHEARPTVDYADSIRKTCESGKIGNFSLRPLPAPSLADVLHSLVMDADAIDYATFEDWAASTGYDADSRQAEKTYRACIEIGLKLRNMLGDAKLAELREAFQDY
jgi:hypothetical protein